MKLITNDETLRKYWPNALVTVKGETSFFDKIAGHLLAAEEWLCNTILSDKVMTSLVKEPLRGSLYDLASNIVVAHAMLQAVPSLDLILTPNGFGVVNTTTKAPASKERVERLLLSLESQRDDNIELLLPMLFKVPEWQGTIQKEFFTSSLFSNLDLATLCGYKVHRWKQS